MIIKSQSQIKNKDNENGLYLVLTPIGNLKDITLRAIETLKKSSYILCEDTRVSKILLDRYNIKSRLISNHKFNESKNIKKIIELLKTGEIISLISDAGTPSISDPGAILIRECVKNNINIIPIPGPSAVSTAVAVSGFSEKFFFYGFFPEKRKILEDDLKNLSNLDSSIVFFISSKKINRIIPYLKKNRTHVYYSYPMKINSEITKIHRDKIWKMLLGEGVPVNNKIPCLHLLPMFQKQIAFGNNNYPWNKNRKYKGIYKSGTLPIAEKLSDNSILCLQMWAYDFTKKDLDKIINIFYKV